MRLITTLPLLLLSGLCFSQDTTFLKVHFLYGSKPLKKFRAREQKWFGGIMGGHVGIESDNNRILNFVPSGKFHWFAKNNDRHSSYAIHSNEEFYAILGGKADSVKKAIVYVPILPQQKLRFDSLTTAYLENVPYDYALIGMRCGAAAYEILGQLGILPNLGYKRTFKKIFYPKKLRRLLLAKGVENNWTVNRQAGSIKRKWESD